MLRTTLLFLLAAYSSLIIQENEKKTIQKNGMTVSWYYSQDRIFFEMNAPTNGWITIGFNTSSGTKDAYLLMGNIQQDRTELVEHYTLNPGNYKPITTLNAKAQVKDIEGEEIGKQTTLQFSLPIKAFSQYQKDLKPGLEYNMILAYSREDDFQHHSMMRTSLPIKL